MLGQAQSKAEIKNVDFTVRNDTLLVTFDLDKAGKNEWFNISLKITTVSGKIIEPNALSGDVGAKIAGGKSKQIVWNIRDDNIAINESIAVEVTAIPGENNLKFVSRGKAVLLSAVVPGLGLTKLDNGGAYWLMAIVFYSAAAGSYFCYSQANHTYDEYLGAETGSERDNLYQNVQNQKNNANLLICTAGAVWLGNMIWTLTARNKTKKDYGISFGGTFDPIVKTPVINISYKF